MRGSAGLERIRLSKYLLHVKSKACLICESPYVDPHHITYAQPKGMGIKVSDEHTVPLCRAHHMDLHTGGTPERTWFALHGIDPIVWAENEWEKWNDENT